ncbi:MAG: hypothetical protein ACFFDT_02485 [Candidatus Hodarchaeota archaeon]
MNTQVNYLLQFKLQTMFCFFLIFSITLGFSSNEITASFIYKDTRCYGWRSSNELEQELLIGAELEHQKTQESARIRILIPENSNPSKNLRYFQAFINSQFNRYNNGEPLIDSIDQIEQVIRDPRIWKQILEEDVEENFEESLPLVFAFGGNPQDFLPLVLNLTRGGQGELLPKSSRMLASFKEIEDSLPEIRIDGFGNKSFLSLITEVTSPNVTEMDRFWGEFNQSDYFYTGFSLSSFGIICNQTLLNQNNASIPLTWAHLAEKQYLDLLELPILENTNQMAQRIFETILQTYGWEKGWTILTQTYANANESRLEYSNLYIIKDIQEGLAGVGWVRDPLKFVNLGLKLVRPRLNETFIDPELCAVLSNALDDPFALEFCARFLAFLLSVEDYEHNPGGQTINLIESSSPVNLNAKEIVLSTPQLIENLVSFVNSTSQEEIEQCMDQVPNLAELTLNISIYELLKLDEVLVHQRAPVILLLFETMILDSFSDLKLAWMTLLENEDNIKMDIDQIGKIPINETEAIEIGLTLLESDTYDLWESYYNEWKGFADDKYATVKEGEPFTRTWEKKKTIGFGGEIYLLFLILLLKKSLNRKNERREI